MSRLEIARTVRVVVMTAAVLSAAAAASAQGVVTTPVAASFVVGGTAKLTLSGATLTFPDADPDTVPSIAANEGPIQITAKGQGRPGFNMVLTVQAEDDLRSGMDIIPAGALTWQASGLGYLPGAASKNVPQQVGAWGQSGAYFGTQTFSLTNSWNYATGTYTARLIYTLVTP